jgi:hypothetical protein
MANATTKINVNGPIDLYAQTLTDVDTLFKFPLGVDTYKVGFEAIVYNPQERYLNRASANISLFFTETALDENLLTVEGRHAVSTLTKSTCTERASHEPGARSIVSCIPHNPRGPIAYVKLSAGNFPYGFMADIYAYELQGSGGGGGGVPAGTTQTLSLMATVDSSGSELQDIDVTDLNAGTLMVVYVGSSAKSRIFRLQVASGADPTDFANGYVIASDPAYAWYEV